MATKKKKTDDSAKEKIIVAARKLFMQKGYEATKTRDIAREAGINLALLNYYYSSKENLFELIMKDYMGQFVNVIGDIVNDESTTIQQKIEHIVSNYIDMLLQLPDMPLFVLTHLKNGPQKAKIRQKFMGSYFMTQIEKGMKNGEIARVNPFNIMLNIVCLTIFPFVARPMLESDKTITLHFNALMQERKKQIPKWIDAILKVK